PRPLQGANRGLPPRAWPVDIDVHLPHAAFHGLARGRFAGPLRGKGRAFSRSLEALIARARPDDRVAAHIGDRHDGVVERRLDMSDPALDDPAFLLLAFFHAHKILLLMTITPWEPDERLVSACCRHRHDGLFSCVHWFWTVDREPADPSDCGGHRTWRGS